ncbi:unnamed protein product [Microthlaspi erraticum]|uniref:Uncharacterized protein n=1 Tax=Microthlaspi erraticum TaxID=1685480 RepID=A0A6D2HC21_9BRAS|nr:unnamed protein product [Microthlaspi erraticum]
MSRNKSIKLERVKPTCHLPDKEIRSLAIDLRIQLEFLFVPQPQALLLTVDADGGRCAGGDYHRRRRRNEKVKRCRFEKRDVVCRFRT